MYLFPKVASISWPDRWRLKLQELRTLNCWVYKMFVDAFLYISGYTRLIRGFVDMNKKV